MTSQKSLISRLFGGLWRFINGTRIVFLNLVFLVFLFWIVAALVGSQDLRVLENRTALVLSPVGNIVEQYSGTPLDRAMQEMVSGGRTETRLRDLVEAIDRAADDYRIDRLVIDPSRTWGIGLATLLELEKAVERFKGSGKPVIAVAENLGQQQYYLAALADEVWLNPDGSIWIDGFASWRQFYAEGLDKLEVEVNLFQAGDFKSAREPWVRNDMSPESKQNTLFWIGDLWDQYLEAVSRMRGIPLGNLRSDIDNLADRIEAVDGDFARFALDAGLVDQLVTWPEARAALAEAGAPGEGSEGFRQVHVDDYLALNPAPLLSGGERQVRVIVAEGEILRGRQPQGTIGAESLTQQLRAVAADDSADAVVLRINSPGGEVFATEKIRREVAALRQSGKPVVVSMGNVAASGGYWIATAGDQVWATPATITGSIGVIGMLPTFQKTLDKIGVHSDGVGTTPLAGKMRLDQPLDEDLRRIYQYNVENTYEGFLELVSSTRGLSRQEAIAVAEGQVWTGTQARSRQLVDEMGTLDDAIEASARLAGIADDYTVTWQSPELSPFEELFVELAGSAMIRLGLWSRPDYDLGYLRNGLAGELLADLSRLARSAEGFTVLADCLCRVD